jgi:hypothetical protein
MVGCVEKKEEEEKSGLKGMPLLVPPSKKVRQKGEG